MRKLILSRFETVLPFLIVVIMFGAMLWSVDFITLQGEWTIYTVECKQGIWNGEQCTGKLAASDRYRFRALKRRKEVLFWVVGSTEPSGRLTPCEIESRSNWVCKASADSPRSITLVMSKGHAVPDPAVNTRPFHAALGAKNFQRPGIIEYQKSLEQLVRRPLQGGA